MYPGLSRITLHRFPRFRQSVVVRARTGWCVRPGSGGLPGAGAVVELGTWCGPVRSSGGFGGCNERKEGKGVLEAGVQAEILRLYFGTGLGSRRIAEQMGLNRKTVSRVIRRRQVAMGRAEEGVRGSQLDPFREAVERLLKDAPNRSAVNILQRLRDAGYRGGYTILKEAVAEMRPRSPQEAYFKLTFAPGEAAQVDWGEFGDVFGDGTKVHAFVMVLCYSRKLYVEFTMRETLGALLRCYERALGYFGGTCQEYWHDNMPTVMAERLGSLVKITSGFWAYAGFHGFKPILCNLARGNEKGRVEDAVKLVRYQFWPGRAFSDLEDLNRQAVEWREKYANLREHRAMGKVPDLVFEAERGSLRPLRAEGYDTDEVGSSRVDPFHRVRFDGNAYTVPWTLVGKTLTVRGDDKEVRIYYGVRKVSTHPRCYRTGQDIQNPAHEEGLREIKPGAQASWQRGAIESWGPHSRRYLELVPSGMRSLKHEIRELLVLSTVYGPVNVEAAVGELLKQGSVGVAHLERNLRLAEGAEAAPPPLNLTDPRLEVMLPLPDLTGYDALLLDGRGDSGEESS